MNLNHQTVTNFALTSIGISIAFAFLFFQPWLVLGVLTSLAAYHAISYWLANYDIDWRLWFSFLAQFLGLIFFVASFIILIMVLFQLLGKPTF